MINQNLGSYRIEAWLSGEAIGRVFCGIEKATGLTVAIKVARSQTWCTPIRLRREATLLNHFHHPNIPQVLAFGRWQAISYLVMEFINGPTLAQALAEHEALPWPEVVELGLQSCEALRYFHQRGVVHCNLKPSHFMLTEQGLVKLIGFGIAKDLDQTSLTATGRTLGTAAYMAPEQIRGTPEISPKTDLYALGFVLYKLLVGRLPFEGNSSIVLMHCHLNEPPPRASDRVPEVPEAMDELIVRLMAKAPHDRPQDATEVENVLLQLVDKESLWVVNKALRVPLARSSHWTLLSRLRNPMRLWLQNRRSPSEPRPIAGDGSPSPNLEDPLWDQELDG